MRLRFLLLAAVVVLSSCATSLAQSSQREEVLRPDSTTPFAIARLVNKSRRAWNRNRISIAVDLARTWERLGIDANYISGCAGDCEAKLFRSELNGRPGKEVILQLTQGFNLCRFLIYTRVNFKARGTRWKLLGHVDHDFNRYQMASHRIVHAFDRNWFVMRGQEGSGSGYSLYGETWFAVNNQGVRPVLSYSAAGGTDPGIGGLEWQLEGRPLAFRRTRHREVIRLLFTVHYTAKGILDGSFRRRFIAKRHADYIWDKKSRLFVFSSRHSTISEREINAVANTGTEPEEDEGSKVIGGTAFFSGLKGFVGSGFEMFLRLNYKRLMRIARGPNNPTKEWLREFLKQCADITEKTALQQLLRQ